MTRERQFTTVQGTLIFRGLTRRCPRCGEWKIFDGFFAMKGECPRCQLDLEPEEGYYVGAMTVAILAAEALTVFLLVLAVILTWPELPVMPLIVIGVGANVIFPILFYPISKTLWLAIDLAFFHRIDSHDAPR